MKSNAPHMLALVAENISIVMTFALSRSNLDAFKDACEVNPHFMQRLLAEIPEERADRALLEMAYLLRSLDDSEGISYKFDGSYGELHKADGQVKALTFRDTLNKVVHASRYVWHTDDLAALKVECVGEAPEKWARALVGLPALADAIGKATEIA